MNRLDEVLDHLEYISEIDPQNSEMLRMRQELEDRGVRHENHCLMHIAANHMKDALLQVKITLHYNKINSIITCLTIHQNYFSGRTRLGGAS